MDILSLAAIRLPCSRCGESYLVPLRDILLSHEMMHEGCPVAEETECPPLFQSRLASQWAIKTLDQAWRRVERSTRADGGELVLISRTAPGSAPTPEKEQGTEPVASKRANKRKSGGRAA
jgi:hypothetical protein